MPKKLELTSLKIQSFVTSLNNNEKNKVKGGDTLDCPATFEPECETVSCETCETCVSCGTCADTCNTCFRTCLYKFCTGICQS